MQLQLFFFLYSFDEFEALAAAEVFNSHHREVAEKIGTKIAQMSLQMDNGSLMYQNNQVEVDDIKELESEVANARKLLIMRYPRLECIENKEISFRDKNMTLAKLTGQKMNNYPGHHDTIVAATAVGNPAMATLLDEVDGSDNGYLTSEETTVDLWA